MQAYRDLNYSSHVPLAGLSRCFGNGTSPKKGLARLTPRKSQLGAGTVLPPVRSSISSWEQDAAARWPGMRWESSRFVRHVAGQSPPHGVDLYLAGAAGERVTTAWEIIETTFGPKVRKVLRRHAMADFTEDDLWADTRSRLMDEDPEAEPLSNGQGPARIIRYRGLVPLLNYMVLIARRIAIGRKRCQRPELSLSDCASAEAEQDPSPGQLHDERIAPPDARLQESAAVEHMRQALVGAYATLTAEQRFLIAMHYRQGVRQKVAGSMLGWNESMTSRKLSAAVQTLGRALQELQDVPWTPTLSAAWEGCIRSVWNATPIKMG